MPAGFAVIIAELEGGRVPWVQPWGTAAAKAPLAMPKNASTDRLYGGSFYAPVEDYVQVPPPQAYFEPINWHRTALHELGHALEPTKTKLVEFGRFAQRHAGKRGRNRPETIYFLGLTRPFSTSPPRLLLEVDPT